MPIESVSRKVTPTAETHYNAEEFEYHLHDLCYNSEELATLGDPDQAAFNIQHMLQFQRKDGFLSNQVLTFRASRWHLEPYTFTNRHRSDYTQPPVLAQAVKTTCDAYVTQGRYDEASRFKRYTYDGTKALYDYHDQRLRFSPDCALVVLIHPHQSGRDQCQTLNGFKRFPKFLERSGKDTPKIVDLTRVPLDYLQTMALNVRQQRVGWDEQKARQNYCKVDVEYNVRYVRNLRILAELAQELGEDQDAEHYWSLALKVESDIQKWMWQPDAEWPLPQERKLGQKYTKGLFLNLDENGQKIAEVSFTNLAAIGLPNLTPQQVDACLRLGLVSFNTLVPFASLPTDSKGYDPNYQQKGRIHNGGAWAYQMRLAADGFREHAQREDLAGYTSYLCELVADLAADSGQTYFLPHKPEFVNAETGEAQRYPKVRGFGMSGQANLMKHYGHLERLLSDEGYYRLCAALGKVIALTELEEAS